MRFDEATHSYFHKGLPFKSVNGFIAQFKEPFEKQKIVSAVAKKQDRTKEEVLEQWNLNKEISCDYGDAVHKTIEYWIDYGKTHKLPHLKSLVNILEEKYDREKMYSEVITYDESIRLSGTLDALLEKSSGCFSIIDWKTNYELYKDAYNDFKEPLDYLEETKINRYRLQLSLYKYLMEVNDFEIDDLIIEHWDGEDLTTINVEPIKVEKLIKIRKQQL